jgi:glucosamine-6-phosphate deaminase
MEIFIFPTKEATAQAAASKAAELLKAAITRKGHATFIAATGASQFDFLAALTAIPDIEGDWTTMFNLDEYIGVPEGHPASFRRYFMNDLWIVSTPPQFTLSREIQAIPRLSVID